MAQYSFFSIQKRPTLTGAKFTFLVLIPWLMLLGEGGFSWVFGDCVVERSSTKEEDIFLRHVSEGCRVAGNGKGSLDASELVEAVRAGKSLDLRGVVIQGDLVFDNLSPLSDDALSQLRRKREQVKEGVKSDQVRVIPGSISIRHSHFTGVVGTNLKQGDLIVEGALLLSDNVFKEAVDFSRTLFLGEVDFSSSHFQQGGYFVQSRFQQLARFNQGLFAERARFHKSHFFQTAHFSDVNFSGMTEFLEVQFRREAIFQKAVFQLGAGFSGAHFQRLANFTQATFQREAFFLYTRFDQKSLFSDATFQGPVTFDKAQFQGIEDFSSTTFVKGSPFAKQPLRPASTKKQEPFGSLIAYGIALAILMVFVAKVLVDRKQKGR